MVRVKRYKSKEVKTVGLEQNRSDMELLDNACQHSKDSSSIPKTLFLLLYLFTLLPFPPSFYLFTSLHLYLLNKIGPVVKMPRPVRVTLKTAIDSRQYFIMKTFVLL